MHYSLELGEEYEKYFRIKDDSVFFFNQVDEIKVDGADPKTFKVLTFGRNFSILSYAIDKNFAYFFILRMGGGKLTQRKIKSNNLGSFEVLMDYYAKDSDNLYYMGRKKAGADPKTFAILDLGYSKDKNNVYYEGHIIEGADSSTFMIVPNSNKYGVDKDHVYWCGIVSDQSKSNEREDEVQNFLKENKNLKGYWWNDEK